MKNIKQLSIIILLLISSIAYAQKPTVDYLKYKKYTTAQKNAISVTDTTKVYIVFDKDLDKLQIYKNGAWKEITPQAALDLKADITYVDDEVQLAKDYTQIIAGETAALRDSVSDVRVDLGLKADKTKTKYQNQSLIAPTFRHQGYAYINDSNILILTEDVEFAFRDLRITLSAGTLDLTGKFRGTYYLTYNGVDTTYSLSDLTFTGSLPKTDYTENDVIIGYTNEGRLYSRFITVGLENFIKNRETIFSKIDPQLIPIPSFRNSGYAYVSGSNILTLTQNAEIPFRNSFITLSSGTLDLTGKYRGLFYLDYVTGTNTYSLNDIVWVGTLKVQDLSENRLIIGYTNEGKLYSPLIVSGIQNYVDANSSGGGTWGSITGTLSNQTDLQTALNLKANQEDLDSEVSDLNTLVNLKANITYVDDEVQLAKDYTQIIAGETAALRDSVADVRTSLDLKANQSDVLLKNKTPFGTGTDIILFGNSITEQNGPYTQAAAIYDSAKGYWNMANFFLNQRFTKIYNAGIGGNTTTQMLARIQTDVIDKNPDVVFFMGGINDINQATIEADAIPADIFGRLEQMYDLLTLNNIKIIASTITPSVSSAPWKKDALSQLNKLISNYAYSNPNIILVDMGKAIVDYTTGDPIANWTDNTHPYDVATFEMGWEVANQIRPFFKETPFLPYFKTDDRLLNSNAFMDGDVSGIATGYTATGITGTTFTKEVRADRLGEWQVITSPTVNGSGNFYSLASASETISFTQGDKIYGACEIEADISELRGCYLEIITQNSSYGTTFYSTNLLRLTTDTSPHINNKTYKGVYKTEPFEIPAGSTRVRMFLRYDFAGEIKVGRMCALKF